MELTLFNKYKIASDLTTKAVCLHERNLVLKDILDIINNERVNTKYKKYSGKLLGIKLAHVQTKDLYYILSVGKDYKARHGSFSKYLFGSLKVKKV